MNPEEMYGSTNKMFYPANPSEMQRVMNEAHDPVGRPSHYCPAGAIEPMDFIVSQGMSFCQGNVVKYVTRYKRKGQSLQDLKKAREYIDRLIAEEEAVSGQSPAPRRAVALD